VNRSAPKATVVPILIYEDVAKAISWLNGASGLSSVCEPRDPMA